MKLLIVGSDEVYAIENFYVRYLTNLGMEVELFPAQPMFYKYYGKHLINKVFYRLGISGVLSKINKAFREKVEAFRPDVIWIFKGMEIFSESVRWAGDRKICMVNYNPDNPFIFTGKGSGNRHIVESVKYYHLHFTYNLSVKEKLEKELHLKTAYLPFGFDVSNELYKTCQAEVEVIKVCFLGNPDPHRAGFITELANAGIEIDIYGNDWNAYLSHPNITIFNPVYGDELWKVLYRYRVQLNLMRIHNLDSHNMRTFEVPGIGGIMVAPDTKEHREFFEEGKTVFLFNSVNECREKIQYLLDLPATKAQIIRREARSVSIEKGYTYKDRAKLAYTEITALDV